MPAYKDEKTGKWYTQFSYKDYDGTRKHTCKRGFRTKKDAQKWEYDFKEKVSGSTGMTFESFVEVYLESIRIRIKESTYLTKESILRMHILPYFKDMILDEITTRDILEWQNKVIQYVDPRSGRRFTKSYLKTIHNQMSAIMNFAVRYYGLRSNPAAIVGNMGNDREVDMKIWTQDQYRIFAEAMMEKPIYFYCFEILYWCGIREGELLALTPDDVDLSRKKLFVTKTFQHLNGRDYVTTPKTRKSKRYVTMPDFLCDELKDYLDFTYKPSKDGRLFSVSKTALIHALRKGIKDTGLPSITVHGLRHSHVSLLVDQGYSIVAIADRVGHESKDISWRYAHLFPSVQSEMADKLNNIKREWYIDEER